MNIVILNFATFGLPYYDHHLTSIALLASHAVVFRGLALLPPFLPSWGGSNTSPLKTTAWEAIALYAIFKGKTILFEAINQKNNI